MAVMAIFQPSIASPARRRPSPKTPALRVRAVVTTKIGMVTAQTHMHQMQRAPITYRVWVCSQVRNTTASRQAPSKQARYQRRSRAPASIAMPVVPTMAKPAMPSSGLGKPKRAPARDDITGPHATNGLMSQTRLVCGSVSSLNRSMVKIIDARKPIADPTTSSSGQPRPPSAGTGELVDLAAQCRAAHRLGLLPVEEQRRCAGHPGLAGSRGVVGDPGRVALVEDAR